MGGVISKINRYELLLYLWEHRLRGDYMHINMKQVAELLDTRYASCEKVIIVLDSVLSASAPRFGLNGSGIV